MVERQAWGRWSVAATELAVVPACNPLRLEADRDALSGLGLEGPGGVALHRREALGVAQGELLGELEHGLLVALDLRHGLDLDAAKLGVLVARLDQKRGPRIALQVSDLLGLRVGVDPALP